ncbi:40S ribosomal protein S8-B [Pseudocercospora fuligena]|uniref:40S ribosomal protein S8 n=1 Tax=Pseudocercospora fuligena TaxID=685502 RepID=A0A8H6REW4_9PEZI|nr:40S ribosomal protein S8-B [Pseudocercospora fuligena]
MPPPPPSQSNIRAYVRWKEPTVYAGEEIECIITFKNIAKLSSRRKDNEVNGNGNSTNHSRRTSLVPGSVPHSRKSSAQVSKPVPLSRAPSTTAASTKGGPVGRGHRPTLSLNVGGASSRGSNGPPSSYQAPTPGSAKPGAGHGRSLSIMSMGSEAVSEGRTPTATLGKRPVKAHGRSASLQYTPSLSAQSPATLGMLSPRQPSPLYEATTPPIETDPSGQPMPIRPGRRRPGTHSTGNTPQLTRQSSLRKHASAEEQDKSSFKDFKFPASPPTSATIQPAVEPQAGSRPKLGRSPSTMHSGKRQVSPRPPDAWQAGGMSSLNPISRVMSETSQEGTPRTSSEFYGMSNHSDETLTSEIPSQQTFGRLLPKFSHSRQASRSPQSRPAEPETLMMAYAQTMGSFTLDGSLVNAAPFEEVKRKGVQGGGGVVGVERSKRSSGLFGALGWGNIGESLGGLLGGDEMSSMAQMKASAGSKTIPLLSTPQSLLFVDLRLAPGESRSYSYRFSLPRGLPPSHRGRAIKVAYHLALSVQRPEGQQVKSVEVPFRVLGSYDSRGDLLGHDLMSPYVLLQDAAQTMSVLPDPTTPDGRPQFQSAKEPKSKKTPKQGLEDFLRYTERLLERPVDENGILLSPTSPVSPPSPSLSRHSSMIEAPPANIREAIDFAILRSNLVDSNGNSRQFGSQSANRFNIARSGEPVAVLTILRPAYRIGESVTGTLHFTAPLATADGEPQAQTYSVLIELESAEHVDPSLALRSASSINRVTRRVHASARENTMFARQISFNLTIPPNAVPTFETIGVNLNWRLKVEFTTQRHVQGLGIEGNGGSDDEHDLFEEFGSDERGTVYVGKERLPADTFEIAVPLKVHFTNTTIMGISRDSRHKRSASGAKRAYYRKKRAFEKGRQPANTRIGAKRVHLVRTRGGNRKFRALRLDSGNFSWGSEGIARKVRVIGVAFHPSNNELVRTNTLTKSAIIQVDAAPFRQWYEAHYGQPLGRRRQAKTETEEVKKSKSVEKKQQERHKALGKVEAALERQFEAGRLYAVVASRPGQSGRVDGYILEGEELAFYQRAIRK